MSTKKIQIGTKPATADAWVDTQSSTSSVSERMKRLTIDVPESLHRTIKAQCAMRGTKISDEVRMLLLQKYG